VSVSEAPRRRAARVLALSPYGRVLLLRGGDPARPGTHIWHAPGGGVEAGEDDDAAAEREFVEETGHEVALGPLVWDRELEYSFNHEFVRQYEVFFLGTVDDEFVPVRDGHNERELTYLTGHGWFDPGGLRRQAALDLIAPPDLADRLEVLLRDGAPAAPVRVQGAVLP
jgi:8-oxo-dGTP pyrophosphatase MutT (NUDIX family)